MRSLWGLTPMPNQDDLCKCGHERKHHTEVLYGFECYGQFWADYKSKCMCQGFEAAEERRIA